MELGLCRSHCWRIICRLVIKGILAGPVKRGTWSHYTFRGVVSLFQFTYDESLCGGFSASGHFQYSAITPTSDPANSSVARKDKEGLFLFDGYLGWSFRIKGIVARVCPTSLPFRCRSPADEFDE